jgi:hypothetical protein
MGNVYSGDRNNVQVIGEKYSSQETQTGEMVEREHLDTKFEVYLPNRVENEIAETKNKKVLAPTTLLEKLEAVEMGIGSVVYPPARRQETQREHTYVINVDESGPSGICKATDYWTITNDFYRGQDVGR